MASASAIEVRVGRGDPSAMALNPGKVLDPTSIGRSGMWRVDGPGVLDVHGYIYFDGKALYVQSADDKQPLMVNKHRVSTAWTEVQAGSTIEIGRAELFYRAQGAADADATIARPMTGMGGGEDPDSTKPKRPSNPTIMAADAPKPGQAFRPGAGTFANRADDESTRLRPIGDDAPPTNQAPRPAAGAPMGRPNIGRPMMDAQESTVIAPIEDLSGGRGGGMGPRPGIGMGGPGPMAGGQMMGGQMGGMPGQMQMGAPGMQGMPPGMMPGGRPGGPGMPGQMGQMPGQMPGQMGQMPGQMPGQMGMPGQPWGMPGGNPAQPTVGQPAVNLSPVDKFKADWQNFPPSKKAIMIGCPFIMIAALFLLFDSDDAAPTGPPKPVASTSATASSTSLVPAGGTSAPNAGMQGSNTGTGLQGQAGGTTNPAGFQGGTPFPEGSSTAPDNTSPFGSSSAAVVASGKDAGAPKDPKHPATNPKDDKDDGDAGVTVGLPGGAGVPVKPKDRTNERMAADTWAEGNYELADRMYEELARQHPENPAFSEAAAILRQKLDAGVQ